jgi:hypothetical protein
LSLTLGHFKNYYDGAGEVAQVVECLHSKLKALIETPELPKKLL